MYKVPKFKKTNLSVNKSKEGEPLHQKVERLTQNNEINKMSPADTKPLVYTDKSAGVVPQTDWRTDKWEEGAATSAKIAREYINGRNKGTGKKPAEKKEDGKTESTAGKSEDTGKTA